MRTSDAIAAANSKSLAKTHDELVMGAITHRPGIQIIKPLIDMSKRHHQDSREYGKC